MNQEVYRIEMGFLFSLVKISESDKAKKGNDYWPLLKHLSDEEFHNAVVGVVREFVPTATIPFPMISQILKFTSSDAQGMALKAVSTLKAYIRRVGKYESVNFNDRILHAVVERFGGWPSICCWGDTEWGVNEQRLIESYKMSYQSGYVEDIESDHLKGISEKDAGYFNIHVIDNKTMQLLGKDRYCGVNLVSSTYRPVAEIEDKSEKATSEEISGTIEQICKKYSLVK